MLTMDKSLEKEIELEYKKIDKKWLNNHYLISVGLVVMALILECGIGWLMHISGEIHMVLPRYLIKYLFIPTIINLLLIFISSSILHSGHFSQDVKTQTISLVMVAICFVIFTVHGSFSALFVIFALPILLTSLYGSYRLSALTSLYSILSLIVSELFIHWNPDSTTVMVDGMRLANFLISIIILLFFSGVSLVFIYFEKEKKQAGLHKELERYHLQRRLEIDDLTGIPNRIAFRNAICNMEGDVSESIYTFAMLDLDNFKQLNDSLGHVAGDRCLSEFGEILKKNCGDALPFRYGGDEFSLLFKDFSMEHVFEVCEKIQRDFKALAEELSSEIALSVSIGLAVYSKGMTPYELISNSDIALYESKKVKNSITLHNT